MKSLLKYPVIFFLIFISSCSGDYCPPGYPDRLTDLDVLPGFRKPPSGYGEVPFWWWTGDTLASDRLIHQITELHKKGISGVQVNYSHLDTPGWLTDENYPGIFTEEWWNIYSQISRECSKNGMGIGLSTYTLDWPRGAKNLFYRLFYNNPALNAFEIRHLIRGRYKGRDKISITLASDSLTLVTSSWAELSKYKVMPERIAVYAYPVQDNITKTDGTDLQGYITSDQLEWNVPEGEWEVWEYQAVRRPGTLNPLLAGSGDTVIAGFFQPFEDRAGSSEGLNYFFNDELHLGAGKFAWNQDFAQEFRDRKGYDLFRFLPAMWIDVGNITPKVRMDYADVRMALMEERYFMPIYKWHEIRGMIFGCDSESRGLDPSEFGDYFRATRWYTAPGHDTPGGKADLIKGKISSSIANLYQRPRVWLEGYHSLGWGAAPEQLMQATCENYLYGCTLLNLHGLYYTTYGSFWEWAPPCYHFRMPYWGHMGTFLDYFERLSYLLSQGHAVNDVAVIYPVAPYEAEMDGEKARDTAFELGRSLMAEGISFEFIDNESLANAVVEDGLLRVNEAGSEYRALVFPDMSAVRWQSIEKAAAFAVEGGKVYTTGILPSASDRTGREDPELEMMNDKAFTPERRMPDVRHTVEALSKAFVQDVTSTGEGVRALHRKSGFRDVYMVMNARPGSVVEFRAKGAAELWDPWTGKTLPLRVVKETATGTQVEMPLEQYQAAIVVFTPGRKHANPQSGEELSVKEITLPLQWTVRFVPTMDNRWGDFRIPVTEACRMIGLEARRFKWTREDERLSNTAMLPETDDSNWETKLHGFGTQFYVLGPVPDEVKTIELEKDLSRLKMIDPKLPVKAGKHLFHWQPYDMSWRWGKEGDQGHQGYHGLKRTVTDDFICLGKREEALNETRYIDEVNEGKYYLWTTASVEEPVLADAVFSREAPADRSHTSPVLTPSTVYVNGSLVSGKYSGISLNAGSNPVLVRYDHGGRGHFVLRKHGAPSPEKRQPLSMRWANDKGLITFDVSAGGKSAEWFRFLTAPGTMALSLNAYGKAEVWLDGVAMKNEKEGYFTAQIIPSESAVVAIRVIPGHFGITGGSLIPEPVVVETTGDGIMDLGDWSESGILNNYSGGVCYSCEVSLSAEEAETDEVVLDLGDVAGTAGILVNGKEAGTRVTPPWRMEVTKLVRKGVNRIEVLVYNTLANHYQTIPSRYSGDPVSGLLGPVKLVIKERKKL